MDRSGGHCSLNGDLVAARCSRNVFSTVVSISAARRVNVLSPWWARRKAMHSFDSGVPVCCNNTRYWSMGGVSGRVSMMYLPAGMKPSR